MTVTTTLLHIPGAKAATFFTGKGLPLFQACGLVAQIQGESTFNPKAVGDHDHSFGLFQLHADRAALIKAGCGIDMLALPAFDDQLAAVWWELNHTEKHALAKIQATTSAYDAGYAACRFYERPASSADWVKRGQFAADWFTALSPPAPAT